MRYRSRPVEKKFALVKNRQHVAAPSTIACPCCARRLRDRRWRCYESPWFMRVSALSLKSYGCDEVFARRSLTRDDLHRDRSSNVVRAVRRRSSSVKEIRSFSTVAVVIGVRCTSIRMCIVLISPLIIAWRATWRRKRRRQRPRRRRRRRSRASWTERRDRQ